MRRVSMAQRRARSRLFFAANSFFRPAEAAQKTGTPEKDRSDDADKIGNYATFANHGPVKTVVEMRGALQPA